MYLQSFPYYWLATIPRTKNLNVNTHDWVLCEQGNSPNLDVANVHYSHFISSSDRGRHRPRNMSSLSSYKFWRTPSFPFGQSCHLELLDPPALHTSGRCGLWPRTFFYIPAGFERWCTNERGCEVREHLLSGWVYNTARLLLDSFLCTSGKMIAVLMQSILFKHTDHHD
jgi:hypothetical protein